MGYYYYCNGDQYYGDGYCNTSWNNWGRWVLAAGLIIIAIIILLSLACIRNRRRRRMGLTPAYGPGFGGQNVPYNNAPPYQAPYQQTGNTYGNDGYYGPPYGGPQPGVELQQPQNVYARAGPEPEYGAPAGPPPGKGDGVIR